jgi:hypothetical protein
MGKAKIVTGRNGLRKILHGSRKVSRGEAIKRAEHNIDGLRQNFTQGLANEISRMEALAGGEERDLPKDVLRDLLNLSAIVFNLAGTLGHALLQSVAASLYDLLAVMLDRGLRCSDPIIVHTHAARLAAPGMPPISQEQAKRLLDRLEATVAHFRDRPDPCNKAACTACPAKAMPT